MSARIAVALIAALAAPQLASARPAMIRVIEADVRAEPAPDAPVVHRFTERAEVSVTEESKEGWRRVRLPDGGTGWIEDAAIALGNPVAAPPPAPPLASPTPPLASAPPPATAAPSPLAPPAQKPDLHPRLYVEDAGQLPRLMGKDPRFAVDAESLANRRKAAFVVGGLGLATSIALTFAGASAASSQNPSDPNFNVSAGSDLMLAGIVTLAVGVAAAILVYPHRGEVLDLLNGWNIAHPEQPLDLQPVLLVATASSDSSATMSPAPQQQDMGPRLVVPATGGTPWSPFRWAAISTSP